MLILQAGERPGRAASPPRGVCGLALGARALAGCKTDPAGVEAPLAEETNKKSYITSNKDAIRGSWHRY